MTASRAKESPQKASMNSRPLARHLKQKARSLGKLLGSLTKAMTRKVMKEILMSTSNESGRRLLPKGI